MSKNTPNQSHGYPCHVLFQFIFAAFLRTQEAIQKLEMTHHELENSLEINKRKLLAALENLAGITSPFRNGLSLNFTLGLLTSLKNDSILFQRNYSLQIPEAPLIGKQATLSWFHCIELHNFATYLSLEVPLENHLRHFHKVKARMLKQLKRLGHTIIKTLIRFKTNENVLLCLMHRQHHLDNIYGKDFTTKILKKMNFSTENVFHFLAEAYKKRGFPDLTKILKI